MNADRIKQIQSLSWFPTSVSVQQALLQVWNECQQECQKEIDASRNADAIVYDGWHECNRERERQLNERAEKAEAYCLRMCEAVKKHRDKFLDKSYCHPVTDDDIDLYGVLNRIEEATKDE